jgi:hypothetical protein
MTIEALWQLNLLKMKQTFLFIALLSSFLLRSQYFELGVFGGVSNYQGDLAPFAFNPTETHLASGLFVKYNFNKYFSLKTSYYRGTISGDDSHYDQPFRVKRNLHFRSELNEFSLFGEMNITGFQPHKHKNLLSPYIFAGIGFFHFNPKAEYEGNWIELQPLGTEGQGTSAYPDRKPYALTQLCVPLGVGFKGNITRKWNLGVEFGWRKTFTDYLDDVSDTYVDKEILLAENGVLSWELSNRSDEINDGVEWLKDDNYLRGDPINKDWYFFVGCIVSYNMDLILEGLKKNDYYIEGKRFKGRKEGRKQMGCPGKF